MRTRVDEFPADAFRGISESNARFIFAGAVLIIFVGVFIADILAAKPYWHDRHDVEDTFAPFLHARRWRGGISGHVLLYGPPSSVITSGCRVKDTKDHDRHGLTMLHNGRPRVTSITKLEQSLSMSSTDNLSTVSFDSSGRARSVSHKASMMGVDVEHGRG